MCDVRVKVPFFFFFGSGLQSGGWDTCVQGVKAQGVKAEMIFFPFILIMT